LIRFKLQPMKIQCGGLGAELKKKSGASIGPNRFDSKMNSKNGSLSFSGGRISVSAGALACALLFIHSTNLQAHSPQQRKNKSQPRAQSFNEGQRNFGTICAGCHGLDGRGSERGPDIARRPEAQRLSDADILQIMAKGRTAAGMPAFGSLGTAKLKAVLSHLRTLQGKGNAALVAGDPQRGKTVFFGLAHPPAEIRSAITNPGSDADSRRRAVTVTTRDGKKYDGVIRNEDNFSLQLQSLDGTFHLLAKSEIEHLEFSPKTWMPADYGSTLDSKELDDLVSYLVSVARASNREEATKSKWQDDDND
jgi:putative heme-binding domain-containing protein